MKALSTHLNKFIFYFFLAFLCGCMDAKNKLYRSLSREDRGNNHYQGHYKISKATAKKINPYNSKVDIKYNQIGIASWYGSEHGFHGKKTANGDKYNKLLLSAAHRQLPLPSLVKVTNLKNNKALIVMVNDRGPYSKDKNRIIDVSERAATILGFKNQGIAKVRVEYLPKETKAFLKDIALVPKHGAKARKSARAAKCTVNCHIKLVNMKHKLAFSP